MLYASCWNQPQKKRHFVDGEREKEIVELESIDFLKAKLGRDRTSTQSDVILFFFLFFIFIIRIMHNAGYNNSTQLTKELYPRIQVSTIHITTHTQHKLSKRQSRRQQGMLK